MRKNKYKTQIKAVKEANSGKTLSKLHRRRIRLGLKKHIAGMDINAFNPKTNQNISFSTAAECARYLNCTRQLISQCIKRPNVFKSAKGWKITLVKNNEREG